MGEFSSFFAPEAPPPSTGGGEFAQFFSPAASSSGGGPSQLQSFGYGAADAASIGFGDEGAGVLAGVGAVLRGDDYALAYRERVDAARRRLEEARALHPVSTMAGSLAGTAATFLIPGVGEAAGARLGLGGLQTAGRVAGAVTSGRALPFGRALTQAAAGRGLRAFGAQSALGAGQGAIFGAAYGAGSANEGDRFQGAQQGAMWGGGLGLAGPAIFQTLGRVGRSIYNNPALRTAAGSAIGGAVGYTQGDTEADRQRNALTGAGVGAAAGFGSRPVLRSTMAAWRNPRAAFANQTGMSIGLPPIGDDVASAAPQAEVPDGVVRAVDRLVGRQGYNVDELAGRIRAAQDEPLGRTLADVGGEQFLSKADSLANLPGQTGPRALAIAEQRARELPAQITKELQTRLGVSKSPTEALNSLNAEYRQISRDVYEPVLRRDVSPQDMQRLQPIIDRLPASIRSRADRVADELATMDGLTAAEMSGAQRIHYLKMAIDDAIAGVGQAEGLGAAQRSGLRRLKAEFLDAIEGDAERGVPALIPGYREARMRWGGLKDAEEAMEVGRRAVGMRPQEVRALMADMTPFEQQHFRIAVADELIRKIQRSSVAVGQRNAANPINNNEIQAVIREVFDNPTEAEAFLRILNERNQLLRNSSGWVGGSATARRAAQAGDQFMAAMGEAGNNAMMGNPAGAVAQTGRAGLNALRSMAFERDNNALGGALLRSVEKGNPSDEAFIAALVARLRKLEQERLGRATSAGREGAQSTIGMSYADDGY